MRTPDDKRMYKEECIRYTQVHTKAFMVKFIYNHVLHMCVHEYRRVAMIMKKGRDTYKRWPQSGRQFFVISKNDAHL